MDIFQAKNIICREANLDIDIVEKKLQEEIDALLGLIDEESAVLILAKKLHIFIDTTLYHIHDFKSKKITQGNLNVKVGQCLYHKQVMNKQNEKIMLSKYAVKDIDIANPDAITLVLWGHPKFETGNILALYSALYRVNTYSHKEELTCKRATLHSE